MKFPLSFMNRRQAASFVDLMLAVASLWLMMATANTSAYSRTSDDVSHSSAAATSSPADWTQFHRDNMQRWNPYETVIGVNNAGGLQLKWKNPIGDYFNPIQSSPAVVNGMVYFGSQDASVYALNASTGAMIWSFDTGGQVFSSPAVANGVVYIGSGDNNVYALNATTGAKLWSFATGNSVISSPTVVNGVVYFGSGDNNVYALNATTGAKLWSFATGGGITYSSPAVANGVVYISSLDNNFYALNASTGAKLWSYPAGTIPGSAAVVNGIVYIGSDNNFVYALNATTGILLWSFHALFSVESSPAVANGVVYFGSDAGLVYALNASTGAQLWSYTTGGVVSSSPAVANGVVYVANSTGIGNLYALNATTGVKLWSYATGTNNSSPTIVGGVVYFRSGGQSGGGNIYAFTPGSADLFLRVTPSATTVHQGDLLTYAFPVWNLGPDNADFEVLNTQVPAGTTFDYIRISGTPGLGMCTTPPYQGTGQIVCNENAAMAPNTTWTVRLTVKVTAPSGTVITENAATMSDTPDPNMANNMATVSLKIQ